MTIPKANILLCDPMSTLLNTRSYTVYMHLDVLQADIVNDNAITGIFGICICFKTKVPDKVVSMAKC